MLAAPFLFDFDSGAAEAVAIVAGVVILVLTASTALPTGLIKSVPVHAHVVLDYVLAALLIASPFLFGFTDDGAARVLHHARRRAAAARDRDPLRQRRAPPPGRDRSRVCSAPGSSVSRVPGSGRIVYSWSVETTTSPIRCPAGNT